MDRRDFLKLTVVSGAGLILGDRLLNALGDYTPAAIKMAKDEQPVQGGWVRSIENRKKFIQLNQKPFMNQLDAEIRGTGAGKQATLWPFFEQVSGGPLQPHNQETGDCVAMAYGLGVDLLTGIQIVKRNSPQRWVAKAATEIIYGGGRIEIGRDIYNKSFRGGGMDGYLAAHFLKKYGVLLRQKYGEYDFTTYSGSVADSLGRSGVPDELEPLCRQHPIGWAALVQSWDEARDCIYNGYPVILCSNQGFITRGGRDKNGYLSPGGKWSHSMLLAGIDEECDRPGGCIINSWGNFVDGGTKLNQPVGSFWADASVISRICEQGDSIAISSYAGYPRENYDLL
jgi:hypothetical protein